MTTNLFNWDEPESDPEPQVWTLSDIYADLGTCMDIAAHLNVTYARLQHWIHRTHLEDCPQPVVRVGRAWLYSKQEWTDWYAKFLRDKRAGTQWTDNTMPFKETRISKLDPNFKFGNPGLNNALKNWRKAQRERADEPDDGRH